MATWKATYSGNSALLRLLRDDEEAMDSEPVEDRLDPGVALGDGPVADERAQLLDDPRAAGVESLDVVRVHAVAMGAKIGRYRVISGAQNETCERGR